MRRVKDFVCEWVRTWSTRTRTVVETIETGWQGDNQHVQQLHGICSNGRELDVIFVIDLWLWSYV